EWELLRQSSAPRKEVLAPFSGLPVPLACRLTRATMPALENEMAQQLARRLQEEPRPAVIPDPAPQPTAPAAAASDLPSPAPTPPPAFPRPRLIASSPNAAPTPRPRPFPPLTRPVSLPPNPLPWVSCPAPPPPLRAVNKRGGTAAARAGQPRQPCRPPEHP